MIRTASILILFLLFCLNTAISWEGGCHCDELLPLNVIDYFDAETIFLGKTLNFEHGYINAINLQIEKGYKNMKNKDSIEIFSLDQESNYGWNLPYWYGKWIIFIKPYARWKYIWQNPWLPTYGEIFVSQCDRLIGDDDSSYKSAIQLLDDITSRCDGYNIYYYPASKIKCAEGIIKNNKPDGHWMFYHINGELYATGPYKDGLKEGTWTFLNQPSFFGRISKEEVYKDGDLSISGNKYFQYQADTIIETGNNYDGTLDKLFRFRSSQMVFKNVDYFKNGYIKSLDSADYHIEYYKNGKPKTIDTSTYYKEFDEKGKLLRYIDYVNNKRIYPESDEYDSLRNTVKAYADSVLISYFGKCFFDKYIRFDLKESCFRESEGSSNFCRWYEMPDFESEYFVLNYEIQFSDSLSFSPIHFSLDRNRKPVYTSFDNSGVQFDMKKPAFDCDNFISFQKAESKFKDLGFINDSTPYKIFLVWMENLDLSNYEDLYKEKIPFGVLTSGKYVWELMYLTNKRTSTFHMVYMDLFDGSISDH